MNPPQPGARSVSHDPEKTAFHEALRTSAPAMPGIFAWGVLAGMAMRQIAWAHPRRLAGAGAAVFFLATRRLPGAVLAGMALFTAFRLFL